MVVVLKDTLSYSSHAERRSDAVPELSDLLLIVVSGKKARSAECNGNGSPSACFDDPWDCRSKQDHTVAQCKFCAVVFVLLDEVACQILAD